MPRYRENPLSIPFSMLCPGISQNTKHHHLTLYKGQVWGEKSYLDLCDNNILSIALRANFISREVYVIMENGELYVPPIPSIQGFIRENTKIPYDSEILQSFAELTHISHIALHPSEDLKDITYHIKAGSLKCLVSHLSHKDTCVHHSYYPVYFWTKEGFKIK